MTDQVLAVQDTADDWRYPIRRAIRRAGWRLFNHRGGGRSGTSIDHSSTQYRLADWLLAVTDARPGRAYTGGHRRARALLGTQHCVKAADRRRVVHLLQDRRGRRW